MKKIINFFKNVDPKYYVYAIILRNIGSLYILFNLLIYNNKFSIGKNYKVWGSIRILIDGLGKIKIGDDFHAVSSRKRSYLTIFSPCHLTSVHGGIIDIGNHVGLNGNTISAKELVSIGDNSMIAPNCIICDHDGHSTSINIDRWKDRGLSKPIYIGKNCWIGLNSIILKGVTIGDNCVIGAGSVVISDCEPNTLYAGNPAKKIKILEK